MRPDDASAIDDMITSCERILAFVADHDEAGFRSDLRTQQAVLYSLLVLGEAVKRLSSGARARHPSVAWGEIAGMRDILIHAYHRVELHQVWMVVQRDLPALLVGLRSIRMALDEQETVSLLHLTMPTRRQTR